MSTAKQKVTMQQVDELMAVWRRLDLDKPVLLVGYAIGGSARIIKSTGDAQSIIAHARKTERIL